MIKAVIFDCFGVLVGSGFKETYRQAGGNPEKDKEFIATLLRDASLGLIAPTTMAQRVARKLNITLAKWSEVVAQAEQPNQYLLRYIEQLKKVYRIAILSNANHGVMERKFTSAQLKLFDTVVVSAEVGMIKPDPGIYSYAATELGVQKAECVLVDDNEVFCRAAQKIGMKTIHYQEFSRFKLELEGLLTNNS